MQELSRQYLTNQDISKIFINFAGGIKINDKYGKTVYTQRNARLLAR